ncbi:MAG: hypothetical protein Kapaf2KO_22550 [Candidatus Kapaibacteriales bacterium]
MNNNVETVKISDLLLDIDNPRIKEFTLFTKDHQEEVARILWEEMSLDELLFSFISNGYWKYEPIIVLVDNQKKIVVEGNRRVAALKILHGYYEIKLPHYIEEKITNELKEDTLEIPAIITKSRKESWKFIGFKHVNGPAKWGSFSKAQYIYEIHTNYRIPINEIAYQIGDTHNTASKLYLGYKLLELARDKEIYDYKSDIFDKRLHFSHLYTALQRDGYRKYLGLDSKDLSENKIVIHNESHLNDVLVWLYGSKNEQISPIIKSQNPDLKKLDEVLKSKNSLALLKTGDSLDVAYEDTISTVAKFEDSLIQAKKFMNKSWTFVLDGYKGSSEHLDISQNISNIAVKLYNQMRDINLESNK